MLSHIVTLVSLFLGCRYSCLYTEVSCSYKLIISEVYCVDGTVILIVVYVDNLFLTGNTGKEMWDFFSLN